MFVLTLLLQCNLRFARVLKSVLHSVKLLAHGRAIACSVLDRCWGRCWDYTCVLSPQLLIRRVRTHDLVCVSHAPPCSAPVPLPTPSPTQATTLVAGSLCLAGVGITRTAVLRPSVSAALKLAITSHVNASTAGNASIPVSDVFFASVSACGGDSDLAPIGSLGRRLQTSGVLLQYYVLTPSPVEAAVVVVAVG